MRHYLGRKRQNVCYYIRTDAKAILSMLLFNRPINFVVMKNPEQYSSGFHCLDFQRFTVTHLRTFLPDKYSDIPADLSDQTFRLEHL